MQLLNNERGAVKYNVMPLRSNLDAIFCKMKGGGGKRISVNSELFHT